MRVQKKKLKEFKKRIALLFHTISLRKMKL
jgi:hypothetical protein